MAHTLIVATYVTFCVLCAAVSKHRTLQPFEGAKPQLGKDIFVAPNASVIGNVTLGDQSSVWYGAILRGEHI